MASVRRQPTSELQGAFAALCDHYGVRGLTQATTGIRPLRAPLHINDNDTPAEMRCKAAWHLVPLIATFDEVRDRVIARVNFNLGTRKNIGRLKDGADIVKLQAHGVTARREWLEEWSQSFAHVGVSTQKKRMKTVVLIELERLINANPPLSIQPDMLARLMSLYNFHGLDAVIEEVPRLRAGPVSGFVSAQAIPVEIDQAYLQSATLGAPQVSPPATSIEPPAAATTARSLQASETAFSRRLQSRFAQSIKPDAQAPHALTSTPTHSSEEPEAPPGVDLSPVVKRRSLLKAAVASSAAFAGISGASYGAYWTGRRALGWAKAHWPPPAPKKLWSKTYEQNILGLAAVLQFGTGLYAAFYTENSNDGGTAKITGLDLTNGRPTWPGLPIQHLAPYSGGFWARPDMLFISSNASSMPVAEPDGRGRVYGVSPATQKVSWTFAQEPGWAAFKFYHGERANVGGYLCVANGNSLTLIGATDGKPVWRVKLNDSVDPGRQLNSTLWIGGAIAYVATSYGLNSQVSLHAVDLSIGRKLWSISPPWLDRANHYAFCATGSNIVFAGSDGLFHCLNPDGSDRWPYAIPGEVVTYWPYVTNDEVYFAHRRGIVSVDARSGEKKWEHTRDVSGAQMTELKHIVINDEACVYSLDAADGKEKWRYEYGERGQTIGPLLTVEGVLYFYVTKTIYALRPPF